MAAQVVVSFSVLGEPFAALFSRLKARAAATATALVANAAFAAALMAAVLAIEVAQNMVVDGPRASVSQLAFVAVAFAALLVVGARLVAGLALAACGVSGRGTRIAAPFVLRLVLAASFSAAEP